MIICEICGAANAEYDEQCRICGHQFAPAEAQPAAAVSPAKAAQSSGSADKPEPSTLNPQPERMASIGQRPATSTPPLLGNPAHRHEDFLGATPEADLPTFMQTASRPRSAPEQVQLISASDLPDWIRQIAEADRAKAEAEAAQQAAHVEAEPAQGAPLFAPDSKAAGPSTSWLSKAAAISNDAIDPWSVTESTAPAAQPEAQFAAYPTVTPTPIYMPEPREKSGRQSRMPRLAKAEKASPTEPRRPIYRNTAVQLALLLLLVVVMAALLI